MEHYERNEGKTRKKIPNILIHSKRFTKQFGDHAVVDRISFEISGRFDFWVYWPKRLRQDHDRAPAYRNLPSNHR